MAGERIAKEIKRATGHENERSDLVFGVVTSTSPLKIKVDNRFEISGKFLILSKMVKDLTVSMTIDGKTGTAQVFRALRTGDKVRMLRVHSGKVYYVLERS